MRKNKLAFTAAVLLLPGLLFAADRDGQHDFDFNVGTWKTHIRRLDRSQSKTTSWVEMDGTVTVRPIWGGRANLEEIEAQSPASRLKGLTLRLYDPRSHQWNLTWVNSSRGAISGANFGAFTNGRGEFYGQDTSEGRTVLVRQIYSGITADSYHFEEASSSDHGRTWETDFIADLTRLDDKPAPQTVSAEDRNRDFDFNFGKWKTHVSRLVDPLTGSKKWAEYDGTSVINPVWNGRASLFEMDVSGSDGHMQGMGLRMFNPETKEWNLNWANTRENLLGVPTVGAFAHGRGEFIDQESFRGRTILVRNSFSNITAHSSRFEQAFSDDGGKTWETNWVMTFVRPEGGGR